MREGCEDLTDAEGTQDGIRSSFRRDLGHAVGSQTVILFVSVLRTLLVPFLLQSDLHGYARWQAYLLYLGYVSIGFLGFNDGLYIRHARLTTGEVRARFSSSMATYGAVLILEAGLLLVILLVLGGPDADFWVWAAVIGNVPLAAVYGAMTYHLQLTQRIALASKGLMVEKCLFVAAVVVLYFTGSLSFATLVMSDVSARVVVLAALLIADRAILRERPHVRLGLAEFLANVSVGSKVMIGAYCALLVAGVVRIAVETWQPALVFAQFAFAYSVSSLVLLAGQAVGTVVYPHLAQRPMDSLGRHLSTLVRLSVVVFPASLCALVPAAALTEVALPKFRPALEYMPLLFAAAMFQLVVSTVNNTYYRLLRLERRMLADNILALLTMIVMCLVLRDSVTNLLIAQVTVTAVRAWLTQRLFANRLAVNLAYAVPTQLLVAVAFVTVNHQGRAWGLLAFCVLAAVILVLQRRFLMETLAALRPSRRHA